MSFKSTSIIAGVALCVGFSINSCSEPIPETKVIRVPTTKVVTKTVTVAAPPEKLPQSCLDALAAVEAVGVADERMTKAAGDIRAQMPDVERNALRDDFKAMNKAIEIVFKAEDTLGTAAHESSDLRERVRVTSELCSRDMAAK